MKNETATTTTTAAAAANINITITDINQTGTGVVSSFDAAQYAKIYKKIFLHTKNKYTADNVYSRVRAKFIVVTFVVQEPSIVLISALYSCSDVKLNSSILFSLVILITARVSLSKLILLTTTLK